MIGRLVVLESLIKEIFVLIISGRGSFGRIYLASDEVDKEVSKLNAQYVVKIEPHTNGPLFVEIHCLKRTAKAEKCE